MEAADAAAAFVFFAARMETIRLAWTDKGDLVLRQPKFNLSVD